MIAIPGSRVSIAAAGIAVLVALAGLQTWRLSAEQRAHAETRAAATETVLGLEQRARAAEVAARAMEQQWVKSMEEIADDARTQIERANADADAATLAGQRLRERVAQLAAACRRPAGDPAPAGSGQAADPSAGLLADMQRRLDEAADRIARHADAARAAGLACERAYGAVMVD